MWSRFDLESDIGGLLWWLLVRFCRTDLSTEQEKGNKTRNVVIFYALVISITFLSVKIFDKST